MNKGGSRESLLKATVRSDFRSLFLKMTDLGVPDLGLGVLCLSIRFLNVQKKRRFFREKGLFRGGSLCEIHSDGKTIVVRRKAI